MGYPEKWRGFDGLDRGLGWVGLPDLEAFRSINLKIPWVAGILVGGC